MNHVATAVETEPLLGRDREVGAALSAAPGRPVEFHAACGYGKSALLRQVAARWAAASGVPALHLQVGGYGPNDLRQSLAELCPADLPLSRVRATVVLDDVSLSPDELRDLLDDLPHCTVIIGCARPLLGRRGRSIPLTGLPADLAQQALCRYAGRELTASELPAAARLVRIAGGQPLRLRQAGALMRDGSHSPADLADALEHDPEALDRLGIDALTRPQQRTLTLLAFAAGALLPPDLVGRVTGRRDARTTLESLHERGLADRAGDRFGLPVRHAEDYLALLTDDFTLTEAVGSIQRWLGEEEPGGRVALDAAGTALAIIGHAAEHGDWIVVARLAETIEPVFALAGRRNAHADTRAAAGEAARRLDGLAGHPVTDDDIWNLLDDEDAEAELVPRSLSW